MVNKLELDIDALIDAALPFAKKMLLKRGTFYPYACIMKPNGDVVDLASYDG